MGDLNRCPEDNNHHYHYYHPNNMLLGNYIAHAGTSGHDHLLWKEPKKSTEKQERQYR